MVHLTGVKWAVAIVAISAAACSVAVGLPMWLETEYIASSNTIFLRYGLWQICSSINSGTLTCAESSSSLERYLATAGAGCLIIADILLIMYTCGCSRHTYLLASSMIILLIGLGLGGAATGIFYNDNLIGSFQIGAAGIVEMVGLGIGLIGFVVLFIATMIGSPDVDPPETPMDYVRNERRVLPSHYDGMNEPDENNPAKEQARDYLDKYRSYQDRYRQMQNENPMPQVDRARIQKYEEYYRQMANLR